MVEKKNKSILDMARSILKTKKMSKEFQVKAVNVLFTCEIDVILKV
jgi:hypothetical protein